MIISNKKKIEVIAYSGYTSNERPLYFLLGRKRLGVNRIQNRWRDQECDFFKIIADDGAEYLIERHRESDKWFLVKDRLHGD